MQNSFQHLNALSLKSRTWGLLQVFSPPPHSLDRSINVQLSYISTYLSLYPVAYISSQLDSLGPEGVIQRPSHFPHLKGQALATHSNRIFRAFHYVATGARRSEISTKKICCQKCPVLYWRVVVDCMEFRGRNPTP